MTEVEFSGTDARIKRGVKLAEDHGHEIERTGPDTYRVPGSRDVPYTVDLERGVCTCPDHQHRGGTCKHIAAVEIVACRRRRTAKPKRVRHEAETLRGVLADPDALDTLADRLGV